MRVFVIGSPLKGPRLIAFSSREQALAQHRNFGRTNEQDIVELEVLDASFEVPSFFCRIDPDGLMHVGPANWACGGYDDPQWVPEVSFGFGFTEDEAIANARMNKKQREIKKGVA